MTVNVGDPLTLSCTLRGSPPDTFTWRKDNGPVLQSTTIPVTYNDNSAIFRADYSIDSVTTSDSGTYTCNVTNPIGSDSATITVVVIGKLAIICDFKDAQVYHLVWEVLVNSQFVMHNAVYGKTLLLINETGIL